MKVTYLSSMQNTDILIRRATEQDAPIVAEIGRVTVRAAHKASCSVADMDVYMAAHYNDAAILEELSDPANIYHLMYYGGRAVGFSKIVLNAPHANITDKNVTKLDRIYLYSDLFGKQLGYHLLNHNIALSKEEGQAGIWLFTWVGNTRAIKFYERTGFDIIGGHNFRISETHSNPNHHMLLLYDRSPFAADDML